MEDKDNAEGFQPLFLLVRICLRLARQFGSIFVNANDHCEHSIWGDDSTSFSVINDKESIQL